MVLDGKIRGGVRMAQQITMTYSGFVKVDGKQTVRIRFEREDEIGTAFAEGTLPSCKIENSIRFEKEEIDQIEVYLREQLDFLWAEAGKIKKDIFTLLGEGKTKEK